MSINPDLTPKLPQLTSPEDFQVFDVPKEADRFNEITPEITSEKPKTSPLRAFKRSDRFHEVAPEMQEKLRKIIEKQ